MPVLLDRLIRSARADIGIIGGADGPTQIFLAASPDNPWIRFLPYGIIALAALLIFLRRGKKK